MAQVASLPDIYPCATCGKPYLDGHPHLHHRPARDWDPMPPRPGRLYCGPLDPTAYWTGADWRPGCCMVHVIAAEVRAELPEHLHPVHASSVTGTVPIPRDARVLDGPTVDAPDSGPLGGWPWASRAHRRFGGVTMWQGVQTLHRGDYRAFPWAYAIEVRLEGYCQRRHLHNEQRWPEHHGRSICSPLVRLIEAYGIPPEDLVARRLVPADRIRLLLDDVLDRLWTWVGEDMRSRR